MKRITITPEMASEIIKNNNPRNRPVRQQWAKALAREMDEGRWAVDPLFPIVFDAGDRTTLIEGQHRMQAVVLHGAPVSFFVAYGDDSARVIMGQVMQRNPTDIISEVERTNATMIAAVLRNILVHGSTIPCRQKRSMPVDLLAAHARYAVFVRIAYSMFGSKTVRPHTAPVIAVVTRALEAGENDKKIEVFCHVLKTGIPAAGVDCSAALALARSILYRAGDGVQQLAGDMTMKTERALAAHLAGEHLEKIYSVSTRYWLMVPGA